MTIVALGDSIINADRSWGYWLSQATDQPLERSSVGGAKSADVLEQLPALVGRHFEIACVTVGTNDVLFDWSPEWFEENLALIVAAAGEHADRVVISTLPLGLGHVRGSGMALRLRCEQANAIVRDCGALVASGSDLRTWHTMSPDRVHPNVMGQLRIADRAAELLGVEPLPSTLHDGSIEFTRRDWTRAMVQQTPKRLVKRALGRAF